MTIAIIAAVSVGLVLGITIIPLSWHSGLDSVSGWALNFLLLLVGISIGRNRNLLATVRSAGFQMLSVPISVVFGTLAGSLAAGALLSMPPGQSAAVGAGFGWYTLSGVLLSQLHSADLGALAFLANISRELMALLIAPLLARHWSYVVSVAPGGATTMDTTLPLISKCTDSRTTLIAFAHGIILSSLVPILVPLLLKLK
jgi:uncharacterized membrane protein YbjE (DUF340 family)